MYDYLIVGSGLYGSIFAHEAHKLGKKVKVIEKREHVGGNVYCEQIEGINVHKYGAHIFHTSDKAIWEYVNSFVEFNRYTNSPMALSKGKIYNLPFNMNTFNQLWGTITPQEAKAKISQQSAELSGKEPTNLEEQAISLIGRDIYETLIKEYTEKQWGRKCKDLPAFIIRRLPVRFSYDNNYFNDTYQGIPVGGYNKLINALLEGIEIETSVDYFDEREAWDALAEKIIYTGPIDRFFDYKFGALDYRSLRFETEVIDSDNYQGNAVVNYIDKKYDFTRIIEHKFFEFGTQAKTVITREYPKEYAKGDEYYYPVNDDKNMKIYKQYYELSKLKENIIFGGRLAEYKYYDMHQVIKSALHTFKSQVGAGDE
ncbi:UDP-galactopyranose mutase [Mixta theicola]|uniref:UDP-galactopyranose mutase n=1 Tax=Mixta theicola TaxID=1458355 RepID=A0A2K1QAA5_9GAMM|nr:UDP-galactopyranose mutase [Mixta theicola]PNS11973.1 UDP-galactopyranose mutase [Mixta theicola]GLR10870.1 UDP-galactopyranose mutase [Mixta theicola]